MPDKLDKKQFIRITFRRSDSFLLTAFTSIFTKDPQTTNRNVINTLDVSLLLDLILLLECKQLRKGLVGTYVLPYI
nr:hypothetical protein [uncultured Tolumonas sp.]